MKNYPFKTGRRLFSILGIQWETLLGQSHSFTTSNLIVSFHMSRFLHVGTHRWRREESTKQDEHEFVTEKISMSNKNLEDFGESLSLQFARVIS